MNATGPHWWVVNIGPGNGFVLSGSKPFPEPLLTPSRHFKVKQWYKIQMNILKFTGINLIQAVLNRFNTLWIMRAFYSRPVIPFCCSLSNLVCHFTSYDHKVSTTYDVRRNQTQMHGHINLVKPTKCKYIQVANSCYRSQCMANCHLIQFKMICMWMRYIGI